MTKIWKTHGFLSYIVVNILIELASNSAQYTGLVVNWPLVAIPIRARFQNQAHSDGPPETTRADIVLLPLACGYLIIYNFYKGSIGFVATWQELWMLVG